MLPSILHSGQASATTFVKNPSDCITVNKKLNIKTQIIVTARNCGMRPIKGIEKRPIIQSRFIIRLILRNVRRSVFNFIIICPEYSNRLIFKSIANPSGFSGLSPLSCGRIFPRGDFAKEDLPVSMMKSRPRRGVLMQRFQRSGTKRLPPRVARGRATRG